MDSERFDCVVTALGRGASRRDVLKGLAGGGAAGLAAALGFGVASPEAADAHRRRRCKTAICKRHRRNHRNENNTTNATTIQYGDTSLIGNGGALPVGTTCDGSQTTAALCQSGYCNTVTNTCEDCPSSRVCGEDDGLAGMVCCVDGYVCTDLGCTSSST